MNILYLCDEYPQCKHGGIGSITQTLARELVRKGHNVFVIGFYPYYRKALPFEDDLGVKILRFFYGNYVMLKLSKRKYLGKIINIEKQFNAYTKYLKQFIHEHEINIIELPDFNESFIYSGPVFIKFPDFEIPTIVKIHGSHSFFSFIHKNYITKDIIYQKEKALVHGATNIIAISQYSKKLIEKIFEIKDKIKTIYNGVIIQNPGIIWKNPDNINVVYAGSLTERKGVINLILAWEKVCSEVQQAKLLLYGKGDSKTINKIQKLVLKRMPGSVEIRGFVKSESLPEIYGSASCAVFPSYAESFSLAPMESMVVGCPTVFTKMSSGPELITNGYDGLLIDPDNIQDIANAILSLLNNSALAQVIGENGAKTIREKFDIVTIGDKHIQFYSDLLKLNN